MNTQSVSFQVIASFVHMLVVRIEALALHRDSVALVEVEGMSKKAVLRARNMVLPFGSRNWAVDE